MSDYSSPSISVLDYWTANPNLVMAIVCQEYDEGITPDYFPGWLLLFHWSLLAVANTGTLG